MILIYSCTQVLAASAETPKTYHLGAGTGDWVEYNVDELTGWASFFIKTGDRLRYEILSTYNVTAYQNGSVAFFFDVPSAMKMFINGVEQEQTYLAMTLLLGFAPYTRAFPAPSWNRCPWAQYVVDNMWGNPFYPAGNDFWSDVAVNYPRIQLSYIAGTVTTTGCDLANFTCDTSVTIDIRTGIMLRFQAIQSSNRSNAIVIRLVDSSVPDLPSSIESNMLIVALALSVVAVTVGVMFYVSRRLEAR